MAIVDNIIFVDTETNGVPKDSSASFKNIDNWPNITQIAWIVYNKDGSFISASNYAISEDENFNLISATDYVPKTILPIHLILDQFLDSLSQCDVIVGHNIEYDVQVILCELYRYGKSTDNLSSMRQFCTMKNAVKICGFDTKNGARYPKLQELYSKLFHQPFDNAHDAYCDIKATADCYWKIIHDELLNIKDFPFLIDSKRGKKIADEYSLSAEQFLQQSLSGGNRIMQVDSVYHDLNRHAWLRKDYNATIDIHRYDKPISLLQKAAELGDANSMYRIASIYHNDLYDDPKSVSWYVQAFNHRCSLPDFYYEFAAVWTNLYRMLSKHHRVDGSLKDSRAKNLAPIIFAKFIKCCEVELESNVISRNHLNLYIGVLLHYYGQNEHISKAIEVCKYIISLNKPEFGKTLHYSGLRRTLARLYDNIGNRELATEQYSIYLQELKDQKEQIQESSNFEQSLANSGEPESQFKSEIIEEYYDIRSTLNSHYRILIKHCMEGQVKDYVTAKHYIDILLSDNTSDTDALYYLGEFYEYGLGDYIKDDNKAFECYEKAAKYVPDAMKKIGVMYLNGIGCKKSKKQARHYLTQAKNKGLDVSPYLEKATPWYIIKKLS